MVAASAHYLLYVEVEQDSTSWHFRLESVAGRDAFDVSDVEHHLDADRLALLALVRGLEALDQASRVTLVTSNAYLRRGLAVGLPDWRSNDWQWERFGQMVPVTNADLWRRVDRALRFHNLDGRIWRFDAVESTRAGQAPTKRTPRPKFLDRGRALPHEEPAHIEEGANHDELACEAV